MSSQKDLLERVVDALNEARIPYMPAGSVGSSFHGQPRATSDVDIVIAPAEAQLHNFVHSLGKDYLRKWAKVLQVESSLEQLLKQAKKQLDSGKETKFE